MQKTAGFSRADDPTRKPPGKAVVVVIDPQPPVRQSIAGPLAGYYRILEFASVEAAAARTPSGPAALLVGEHALRADAAAALATLRRTPAFKGAPIIACLPRGNGPINDWIPASAVDGKIELPFRYGDIAILVARLGKTAFQKEWAQLPARPRQALRKTLAAYHGMAELIANDAPLDYRAVTDACAPVLSVVKQADHGYIFDALTLVDDLIYVHSLRVSTMLAMFGFTIGLNDDELLTLACGGLMFDIGKTLLPYALLHKPGSLTAAEWELVREHVDLGQRYVGRRSNGPSGIQIMVGQHHERLDGSGYPGQLGGDKLNDLARMAAIVDVFAALTEERPYRPAFSVPDAFDILAGTMSGQFDQGLLSTFRQMLQGPSP